MPSNRSLRSIMAGTLPLTVLWRIALLVAIVNVAFVVRRAPVMAREGGPPDEGAVQASAVWLRQEPPDARLLLLRSHRDMGAPWFNYRLNYLIYPRRHDSAWESPPPDAGSRYDLILAVGAARSRVSSGWAVLERFGATTLYGSASRQRVARRAPPTTTSPDIRSIALGVAGVAAVPVLGLLLLVWTTREPPFGAWWANLAVAHLVGATGLTGVATVSALLTHRLLVWPVYALILLLAPRARRAAAYLLTPAALPSPCAPPARPAEALSPGQLGGSSSRFGFWHILALAAGAMGLIAWIVNAKLLGIGWDGYSIWQFKAEAFVIDGSLSMLRDARFADYAHLDYPLLVPLQTWWVSVHSGGYREVWAQLEGGLFGLDMLALYAAFAGRWVGREAVLVGCALLVSLPVLTTTVASGFADIEMACWLLALALFMARITVCGEQNQFGVLAWLFAGVVLVKNEGMLAAAAGLAVYAALGRRPRLAELAGCLSATVCAFLPWLIIKRSWRLTNDLLEEGGNPHLTAGLGASRIGTTLIAFARCLSQTGPRAGGWGLLIALLPVGLWQTLRRDVSVCNPLWLLCGAQTVGYILVYLVTPHDLREHLSSSVDRLTLHLVPTALMASLVATFHEPANSSNVRAGV